MWQIIKNEWQFLGSHRTLLGISIGFVLVLLITILLGNYEIQKQSKAYQAGKTTYGKSGKASTL